MGSTDREILGFAASRLILGVDVRVGTVLDHLGVRFVVRRSEPWSGSDGETGRVVESTNGHTMVVVDCDWYILW